MLKGSNLTNQYL